MGMICNEKWLQRGILNQLSGASCAFFSQKVFSKRNALFLVEVWPNGSTGLLNLARKPFEISIMSNDQSNGLVHHACVP